jgi:hypothetical protein
VSIRTPDQRLRVFVSSTLGELADERRAVRDAIKNLWLTPVMFEQGARPHPPRALYRAYLEQSDIFIGRYWERYGGRAWRERVGARGRVRACGQPAQAGLHQGAGAETRVAAGESDRADPGGRRSLLPTLCRCRGAAFARGGRPRRATHGALRGIGRPVQGTGPSVAFYADEAALEGSVEAVGPMRDEVVDAMGSRVVAVESHELVAQSW